MVPVMMPERSGIQLLCPVDQNAAVEKEDALRPWLVVLRLPGLPEKRRAKAL